MKYINLIIEVYTGDNKPINPYFLETKQNLRNLTRHYVTAITRFYQQTLISLQN